MYRKTGLLLLFTALFFTAYAQNELIRKLDITANSRLDINGTVTAIVFKSEIYLGTQIDLRINGETESIPFDADGPQYTYFKSLDGKKEITSLSSDHSGSLHLINSGSAPKPGSNLRRNQQDDCDFTPNPIPQSEWREGLPVPNYSRGFTTVEHVVVHHSAGSNSATNYTQVVRDIYIYHTQSNGWSDIGYNYLIAQNGDLYAGRDPDGGEQDNVIGAHFCGSNSKTMGVCLMGNYETAEPTDDTWKTLQNLAAYKLNKESLDPQNYIDHPLGFVGTIAGHRDGCSTACPGENVYAKLEELRDSTSETLVSCDLLDRQLDLAITSNSISQGEQLELTNNSTGYLSYKWLLEGAETSSADWPARGFTSYPNVGTFDITLIGFTADNSDTLTIVDAIEVEKFYLLDFSVSSNEIYRNESVTFQNLSIGYNSYKWLLEEASPNQANWNDSGAASYPTAGTFDIALIGFKEEGSDTLKREDYISVVNNLSLSFGQNRFTLQPGDQVSFTNQSTGYDEYQWVFEGGEVVNSSEEEAIVTYTYPGLFDAMLIGQIGSESDTVHTNNQVEVAGFTIFPNPTHALSEMTIATNNAIKKIEIIGMDGKKYLTSAVTEGHTIQLPFLRQGVYVLKVYTSDGLEKQRIIIN